MSSNTVPSSVTVPSLDPSPVPSCAISLSSSTVPSSVPRFNPPTILEPCFVPSGVAILTPSGLPPTSVPRSALNLDPKFITVPSFDPSPGPSCAISF